MIAGCKRGREEGGDNEHVEGISLAIQKMALELDSIAGTVGKVNSAVLQSALSKVQDAVDALTASRGAAVELWRLIIQSQQGRTAAVFNHIAAAADMSRNEELIAVLQQQLVNSAKSAAEETCNGISTANAAFVALFSSQLKGEQEVNERLVLSVRDFFSHALEAIQTYSRRAIKAELLLSKNELANARLQSSVAFYQSASLRHHDEILALIKIVRLLAAKNKDSDIVNFKLRQAKSHVRLLEKHLDLAGIVHAIVPPESLPPCAPKEPPNDALKKTAPEYFALRLLEHRDMTLSELVSAWQQQEARILAAEDKYQKLKASVETMRQEAMTVQQGFIEEKRRREVVEHRLVDLVRERIHPSKNDALVQQLTHLRDDYTKALDDLAQLKTALVVTRESLALEKQRSASLEVTLQQMKDDSQLDEVANTLTFLRSYYKEEVDRLRQEMADANTETALAVARTEMHQEMTADTHRALTATQRTVMDLSAALQRAEEQAHAAKQQKSFLRVDHVLEDSQKALASCEAHMQKAMAAFQMAMLKTEARQKNDIALFEKQLNQLIGSFKKFIPAAYKSDLSAANTGTKAIQDEEVRILMRGAVANALQLVSESFVTNELAKSSLIDTTFANAQHLSLLLEKLRTVTEERDAALKRLSRCEQFIEQHSLTALERVQMHEVSAEDLIDVTEASEQVATMREKVSSLDAVCATAMAEVKKLREERKHDDREAQSDARRLELLERHNRRLSTSLEKCLGREAMLLEQLQQLQRTVRECGASESCYALFDTTDEMMTAEGRAQMRQKLENLCCGINGTGEQIERASLSISTAAAAAGETEAQLMHSGVRHVASSLRKVIRSAELLRHSLPETTAEAAGGAVVTAVDASTGPIDDGGSQTGTPMPQQQLATHVGTNVEDIGAHSGELALLRKELEAHTQVEKTLKRSQQDLQQQNDDLKEKVGRLLQINKKLLDELRFVRSTTAIGDISVATDATTDAPSS